MPWIRVLVLLIVSVLASPVYSQTARTKSKKPSPTTPPLHLLGIRPGVSLDSVEHLLQASAVAWREASNDTLTRNYGDKSIKLFIVDSIFCRLTYMRFVFVFEAQTARLRRLSITPRFSAIQAGRTDDLSEVLLLYFGQGWGKPEIQLDLAPAQFRWYHGNIEVKGFIRRGYPLWTLEG
jgi:hypothetical protein